MTFEEVLAQIIAALQREQRISYRALQRRFVLEDAYLEDVKEELIYAHWVHRRSRAMTRCRCSSSLADRPGAPASTWPRRRA